MTWTISTSPCVEHDDCSAHTCTNEDGFVAWVSHAHSDISDAARLNLDYPTALADDGTEITWQAATPDEAIALGWGADTHRVVATLGAVLEIRPADQVAATSGIAAEAMIAEAEAWAVAEALGIPPAPN